MLRVCGLCLELVERTDQVSRPLLLFLHTFLDLPSASIPDQICPDCSRNAKQAKKFKENSLKCLENVQRKSSQILKNKEENLQYSGKRKRSQVSYVEDSSPKKRAKSPLETSNKITNKCRVDIPLSEKRLADGQFAHNESKPRTPRAKGYKGYVIIEEDIPDPNLEIPEEKPLGKRRRQPEPVSAEQNTAADDLEEEPLANRKRKKRRRSVKSELTSVPLPVEPRSQSNRAAKHKAQLVTAKTMADDSEEEQPSEEVSAVVEKVTGTQPGPDTVPYRPPSKRKQTKRSAQPRGLKGYVMIEEDVSIPEIQESPKVVPVPEEKNDEEEETFPALGPYQCEICQNITDTKQEFVDHIKSLHSDQVDESVLQSLESDLKKRKRKELKQRLERLDNVSSWTKLDQIKNTDSKPRMREQRVRTYTEDDSEDDFLPRVKRKKRKEKKERNVKTERLKAKYGSGPGTCSVCGTILQRAVDIPKHQESLKCRQVKFKAENLPNQTEENDPARKIEAPSKGTETSETPRKNEVRKQNQDTLSSDIQEEEECLNNSNGTHGEDLNETNEDDISHNIPNDAKFKASIAKRYKAQCIDAGVTKPRDYSTDTQVTATGKGTPRVFHTAPLPQSNWCQEATTVDLSTLGVPVALSGHQQQHSEQDTIESRMAALHGQHVQQSREQVQQRREQQLVRQEVQLQEREPQQQSREQQQQTRQEREQLQQQERDQLQDSIESRMAVLHGFPRWQFSDNYYPL